MPLKQSFDQYDQDTKHEDVNESEHIDTATVKLRVLDATTYYGSFGAREH